MTLESPVLSTNSVPLRTGPPTKEEMLVYYPGKFTWNEMKTFVNSGFVDPFHIAMSYH